MVENNDRKECMSNKMQRLRVPPKNIRNLLFIRPRNIRIYYPIGSWLTGRQLLGLRAELVRYRRCRGVNDHAHQRHRATHWALARVCIPH